MQHSKIDLVKKLRKNFYSKPIVQSYNRTTVQNFILPPSYGQTKNVKQNNDPVYQETLESESETEETEETEVGEEKTSDGMHD